jgi:hypothetical protein
MHDEDNDGRFPDERADHDIRVRRRSHHLLYGVLRGRADRRGPVEVAHLMTVLNLIRASSLSPRESLELIGQIRSEIT